MKRSWKHQQETMCHNLIGLFPLGFQYFSPTASFFCAFAQINKAKKTPMNEILSDVISFSLSPFSGQGDGMIHGQQTS